MSDELWWPASAAVLAAVLWFGLVRRQLEGEPPARDGRGLVGVFLLAFVAQLVANAALLGRASEPDFAQRTAALGSANAVGVLVALLFARGLPLGRAALGMQAQLRGSVPATVMCAYLASVPLLFGLRLLSDVLLPLVLDGVDVQAQQSMLREFLESEAGRTPMVWLSICLVIPFAEELLFRGALFAGLRERLGPWPAACLSSAAWASLHDSPTVLLPLFGFGVLLAWLRERTGSLAAPTLVHAINNTVTLVITLNVPPESLS